MKTVSFVSSTAHRIVCFGILALVSAFLISCNSGGSPPPPPAPDTIAPSAPANLMATAASSTQINLAWSASTDNVGVTGYQIERCQTAGCSNFVQVASTTAATAFNDTGLTASTSYSYRAAANCEHFCGFRLFGKPLHNRRRKSRG